MKISATNTAEREIVSTRNFDAPRELVWEAWRSFYRASSICRASWHENLH